jgi:hypothetical protein
VITEQMIMDEMHEGRISRNVARALLKALLADTMPNIEVSFADEVRDEDEEDRMLYGGPAVRGKRPTAGYIYLLRAADGHYKIGRAVNVGPRVRQIGTDIPYKVETIHTFHAEDYCAVELELHKRFADKRANGEWFRLDAADVEYICSLGVPAPASD